jgi:hypothetical protein
VDEQKQTNGLENEDTIKQTANKKTENGIAGEESTALLLSQRHMGHSCGPSFA